MRKRILCFALVLSCIFFAGQPEIHAAGLGLGLECGMRTELSEMDGGPGVRSFPEAALSLKIETVPLYFSLSSSFKEFSAERAALSVDYWISNPRLGNSVLHYFWGPGLSLGIMKPGTKTCCFGALRFVLGVNFFASYNTEFYFQMFPEASLVFASGGNFNRWSAGAGLGFRQYF